MKQILIFCLLFAQLSAYCQVKNKTSVPPLPLTGSNIVYTASVTATPTLTKTQLFNYGQEWYRRNFQSADNTLNINDADAGKLSGTGILHAGKQHKEIYPQDIFFTVTIVTVSGGYIYRVDSIYSFEKKDKFYYSDMYNEERYPLPKQKWDRAYREYMLNYMNERITGMISQMHKEISGS